MKVIIRQTTEPEFQFTETLTRNAFWDVYKPGCDEHLVLSRIRKSKGYIKELDLIALVNNEIFGHAICSKARVTDPHNVDHEVLCLGPISVNPSLQKKGIGSELMIESINVAKKLGYPGMILFGNPGYYSRFGFSNAIKFNISTKDGQNLDPFMALELKDNGLRDIKGRFFEDKAFEISEDDLTNFEKQFPFMEKHVTATQLKF